MQSAKEGTLYNACKVAVAVVVVVVVVGRNRLLWICTLISEDDKFVQSKVVPTE